MSRKLMAVLVIAGIVGWFVVGNSRQEDKQPAQEQQPTSEQAQNSDEPQQPGETAAVSTRRYTAQRGDSYTEIARKSIQAYIKQYNVELSPAAIIFAETNLTKQAGSPRLEIGQQVELAEESLKQWVDQAKTLTAEQQAKWNKYVSSVNFNTDAVGVAR